MFSRFFIDRPIFAAVLSVAITLTGWVALFNLPLAQYPQITPPSIIVSCTYPGASAEVVAQAVAAPIEQEVNGVEDMLYMSSASANDGSYSLTVTFKPGVDLSFAQVLVQNRVNLALPQLPDVVKQTGVTTRKRNPDILLIISVYSPKGRYDELYVSNYATIHILDEIARVDGVGDTRIFGAQDYSMRVWVDPDRLAELNLTASDVLNAVREQNMQVAAGQSAQPPNPSGAPFEYTVHTLGRLSEPEQFEDIVLKAGEDGRKVRIRDVGHVTLGARSMDVSSRIDNHPCASLAVWQLPYANALQTADNVRQKMEELKESFPQDIDYQIAYDTTPFIRQSIRGVIETLVEAIILVAVVVLIFLQNWRSTLIPLTAVPVAIIGTFAAMAAIGFSLNNLTLFGLVLAIGIVVDDAIVVVEAVEHHIEQGMHPKQAAIRAMREVSGPVIAVALVLSAVFLPCAFISGITGQFFRQFALTIAVSTVLSAFNSLTLSPALAALLLQDRRARKDVVGLAFDFCLGWFFRLFNWGFRRATGLYSRVVGLTLRLSIIVLVVYVGLLGLTGWTSTRLPTGYIPVPDQSRLYMAVQLPDSASMERTQAVVDHLTDIALHTRGVSHALSVGGQSFTLGANGSNFGNLFITLDDFDKRHDPSLYYESIQAELRKEIAKKVPEATVVVLGPPAVSGLGSAGGFKFMVEDRSGDGDLVKLQKETQKIVEAGRKDKKLSNLLTVFHADSPMMYVDVDRRQCETMGVNPRDVFTTLQVYLGSYYVNDFNKFGRTWQVVVQAEGDFRNDADKVRRLKVRNADGAMVPLGAVLDIRLVPRPILVSRYNMYPAAAIVGGTAPGVSTGQGIEEMQRLAGENLSKGMGYEWTEINYIQIDAAKNPWNNLIFPLAVAFVFLVLAAQYESWALPLAVILVVPMCILGSLTGVALTHWDWLAHRLGMTASHSDINIFTQIGLVVLVGLASKNAILIVEFAKHKREAGLSRRDATLEAVKLRLRPILMTSFAFILGVVPLMLAVGAGAEMRRALGLAVFSGMLGVTLFGVFLTPVFFYVVEWFAETSLLASPEVRLVGRVMLFIAGILTLGIPWLLVWVVGRLVRRPAPAVVAVPPSANGNGRAAPREVVLEAGDDDPDPDRILSK
jgi:multidrug efflux pump